MEEYEFYIDIVKLDEEGREVLEPTKIIMNENTIRQIKDAIDDCDQ